VVQVLQWTHFARLRLPRANQRASSPKFEFPRSLMQNSHKTKRTTFSAKVFPVIMPSLTSPDKSSDFSLANLPYGMVQLVDAPDKVFPATRVGNQVVNLAVLAAGLAHQFQPDVKDALVFHKESLNRFMALPKSSRRSARQSISKAIQDLLMQSNIAKSADLVFPMDQVKCLLPCVIGDYSDFYASRHHAVNAGTIYRGAQNALQPNWLHLPVGYHGRSSSIVVSGTRITRPCGQLDEGKIYAPCRRLDFELEIGILLGGQGNALGTALTVDEARDLIFGYVLLNDWSARDVQAWEYVPLGPFCAKNFATSISPWIVPAEAVEDYLVAPVDGAVQNPQPLANLRDPDYRLPNLELVASLKTLKKKQGGQQHEEEEEEENVLCVTNMRNLHWTPAQMIAHHASTGCNMRPGDLLGTGTISGPDVKSMASLLEVSWNGQKPFSLKNGETRTFLQDGDSVILRGGLVTRQGLRIGFGSCEGTILPANSSKL